ncbi:MipA/OmpV family protein [Colwellia sp. D2M02]|uniref:MipA/OmpV family protein n=1 Tax=Colwellia sp. D2M02 TaxID=2841562 RepID=UPI001C099F8B|nr:MipA/OmpV family protein [Colwellia sp. D2M02]MBU2892014.1 MipA/OmpV family protein [Colwellia sp. D2M02]
MNNRLLTLCFIMLSNIISPAVYANSKVELGIGAFSLHTADYPGSNEYQTYVVPLPYFHYESEKLSIDREGLTGWLWQDNGWYLDISMSAGIPVNSDDNKTRRNMPDIDWSFELGPSIKHYWQGKPNSDDYLLAELYTRKVIATDFRGFDDIGWRTGLRLAHQKTFSFNDNSTLEWANALDINTANDELAHYFYGVDSQYQTATRSAYNANGGYAGTNVSTGLVWKHKKLWLAAYISAYSLHGSQQENSPLVNDVIGYSAGVGIVWILYQKG